jgi:hypothetical protein
MYPIAQPIANVHISVYKVEGAEPISLIVFPLALVHGTIEPYELSKAYLSTIFVVVTIVTENVIGSLVLFGWGNFSL